MALISIAPVIAPIAGGWITVKRELGWHWTEWVTLIISSTAFLISFLFLPETYLPKLLDWKAAHLRRLTNDPRYVSAHARNLKERSFGQRLRARLSLPVKFIHTEPVITVLGVYSILLYTLLFTFQSGFDKIFKNVYHLSTEKTGACFGAIAAGVTFFLLAVPGLYLWARRKAHLLRKDTTLEPEFRLYPGFLAGPLLPVALFWLGWTDVERIPMWSVLGACFLFGLVLMAMYTSSYGYIVDSYGTHAASALSAITMLRYIIAGGMAMGTRPLFTLHGFGVKWTMTVLGSVAVLLAPAPFVFWRMGPRLRARSAFAVSPKGKGKEKEEEGEGE